VASVASIEDVRRRARRRVPGFVFDYVDGAAGDEWTARRNREGFAQWALKPEYLEDVAERDLGVDLLGTRLGMPVLLSPTGLARLSGTEGDLAAARAAGQAGTVFILPSSSSHSIEEVAAVATGPLWLQVFLWSRRDVLERFVSRAEAAGFEAIVVTVDVPVVGRRDRDIRNGFSIPPRLSLATATDMLRHPLWMRSALRPTITFKNFDDTGVASPLRTVALAKYVNEQLTNPGATYADLEWLRSRWKGRLLVKGVMTSVDAERSIACGVDGIMVSNHGGRQLDGVPGAIDVLEEIVEAADGRAEIILDGGVRRGTDILKALALGARAVSIGRPWVYGLAADGERGVHLVLRLLRDELDTSLALVGRRSLGELGPSLLRPVAPRRTSHAEA
jgi:L-lactate dehydrogenase (cytochrome)